MKPRNSLAVYVSKHVFFVFVYLSSIHSATDSPMLDVGVFICCYFVVVSLHGCSHLANGV